MRLRRPHLVTILSLLLFPGFIVFLRSSSRKIALLSLPIKVAQSSLCLIKHHAMETYGNGRIAPGILSLGTTWKWVIDQFSSLPLYLRERTSGTHWTGRWGDTDAVQNSVLCFWRTRTRIPQLSTPQSGCYTHSERDCQLGAAYIPHIRRSPQISSLSSN
jgi:hypothetical protein